MTPETPTGTQANKDAELEGQPLLNPDQEAELDTELREVTARLKRLHEIVRMNHVIDKLSPEMAIQILAGVREHPQLVKIATPILRMRETVQDLIHAIYIQLQQNGDELLMADFETIVKRESGDQP